MRKCAIIVTIKNRLNHFLKTFPFMVSQYGVPYDLVLVNFHSNDDLEKTLFRECEFRKDTFSPHLQSIKQIKLLEDLKFNPRRARNLGASYYKNENIIFAFNDVDTFLGMSYLDFWSSQVERGKTFVSTRIQDTKASSARRLEPEVNYGNFLTHSKDYFAINGFNENVSHYGGDDDDIYHRLKLFGLREINPYSAPEARQYSILHGDDLRLPEMETSYRVDQRKEFEKIYNNNEYFVKNSIFLDINNTRNISREEVLYEK